MDRGGRLLEVRQLQASYDGNQVLFGVTLDIAAGELVAMLGRNGMGKTSTVRAIMGLLPAQAGSLRFKREAIRGRSPHRIARAGIGLVPEGRQIFPTLTVRENLVATARERGRQSWTLGRVFELFPALIRSRDTMGSRLSRGERQMLAIGRALMTNPDLLILDEPAEGLEPRERDEIWNILARLKREGASLLVVDNGLNALTRIADRHYIMQTGRTVWSGSSADLLAAHEIRRQYLGV